MVGIKIKMNALIVPHALSGQSVVLVRKGLRRQPLQIVCALTAWAASSTAPRSNKSSAPIVDKASTTNSLDKLQNLLVQVAKRASGRMILDVLLIARSAKKESTTMK